MTEIRIAVVTVSDKGYTGERTDASGPLLADLIRPLGTVVVQTIIPDEFEHIRQTLIHLADELCLDLILTTGGTGLAPRDQTPEATRAVIERQVPGLAEVLRWDGYQRTPYAILSRGLAGLRGKTLIINLPGSPRAVREGVAVLLPILPHALQMARGENLEHSKETTHG